MERFNILKHKNFQGLYAIFDNEAQSIAATADTLKEAKAVVEELNLLIRREQIVDEAMTKLFG